MMKFLAIMDGHLAVEKKRQVNKLGTGFVGGLMRRR
jgi:hypothetical protein